jgi:hypothetical protein
LLIHAVTEIARHFYCSRVILTGNKNKIPSNSKWVCRRSSDYDRAWREVHAASRSDGNFELICKPGPSRQYWISRRPADRLMNNIRFELVRCLKRHRDPQVEANAGLERFLGAAMTSAIASPGGVG